MIYILPIKHDIQLGYGNTSKRLLEHITKLTKELKICFIAEEIPLDLPGISISEIGRFACNNNYSYKEIDPSAQEAEKLNLPTPEEIYSESNETRRSDLLSKHAKKKEDYWLHQLILISKYCNKILLVCGIAHVSSNPESKGNGIDLLLEKSNLEVTVLDNFI